VNCCGVRNLDDDDDDDDDNNNNNNNNNNNLCHLISKLHLIN
jgi:hypothetical protein